MSATDVEKAQAREVAEAVRSHLRTREWPEPLLSDSGNGYHLLYRIDLPAEDDGLVKRVLHALAAKFNTEAAEIDLKVFNPSRICKLPGTWARKGEDAPDRPHRPARIMEGPEQLQTVPEALLTAVAAESPKVTGGRRRAQGDDGAVKEAGGGRAVTLFGTDFDNKSIQDRLTAKHLAELRQSGLSDKAIRTAGFHTREGLGVTRLIGWKDEKASLGAALVIPYRDAEGHFTGYFRVKPDNPRTDEDGKAIKYEAPIGQLARAYIPAGTAALKDGKGRLIITEGEKKAAKADQEGFPCIGIAGVWSWQKRRPEDPTGKKYGERELIDDLDRINWKDHPVVIAFDSDAATNDDVLWAEWHLAQALVARGAVVRIARIPAGPAGDDGKPTKVGLDDYLVAHGREAFQKLLLEADLPQDPRYASPKGHLTDWGNAQRLVKEHGRDLRYYYPWQAWLVWDGTRWLVDQAGEAMRRAKQTVARLYKGAAQRVNHLQEELDGLRDKDPRREQVEAELAEVEAVMRHAKRSESTARLQAMLVSAQSEPGVAVSPDELDRDPWLLNVENGTLDLRAGQLRPHRREDLITKLAPVVYDAAAESPVWEKFLGKIMDGNADMIAFLQRVVGYALTGRVNEQVLFFLYGTGANGKSTFLNTLQALLRDYAMQAPPELLMMRKGEVHSTERADLYRRRLVACVEVDEGRQMAESLVKQLTGGERVRARRMRQDFWEFDPTHKLFLAGNHRPTIHGADEGIWRRVKLVPFTVSIPEGERDRELPDKLLKELPGILAWAVRGGLKWQRDGLNPPDEVEQATAQYRDEMDDLSEFLDACCVVGKGLRGSASRLYQAFVAWASTWNARRLKQTDFRAFMEQRRFERRRSGANGEYEYHGLDLKEEYKASKK